MSIAEGTVIKIAQNILLPDEQTAINIFWAVVEDNVGAGPLAEADVLAAVGNWMDAIYANLVANIVDDVVSTVAEVWTVNVPLNDLTFLGLAPTTWAGSSIVDPFPNGVAAICSLLTTDPDVTGRKFVPGFAEDNAFDNDLSGTPIANLILYALDWAAGFLDVSDVLLLAGVYSPTKLNFLLASGVVIVNAILGYQRRRKPGVGS